MSDTETQLSAQEANTKNSEFKFRFRKDKLGNQRAPFALQCAVPTLAGLAAIIVAGGKPAELLLDVASDTIRDAVASWVQDSEENSTQEKFNTVAGQFTFEAIASQDRVDRRANSIPEETWEAFAKSYTESMPAITGKTADQVGNAVKVFLKKFSIVKADKKIVGMLKDQLGIYMSQVPDAENYSDILELLVKRADNYLQADDVAQIVNNL